MSKFFINRPIFAWVIAILIMMAGVLSIVNLPITQYPNVAAPAVYIRGAYPGASAQTVQDTTVQVIEQQINGLDGFRYMSSEATSDGGFVIIVTFNQGTDPDIAQVQVQNKLSLATPMLPAEVQAQGIAVGKFQVNFMMAVGLYCDTGQHSEADLGNYLISNIKDPLSRTQGVGEILDLTSQYAMRIWLNPEKLESYQLMPQDVIAAVESQNVQISSGQLGSRPTKSGVQLNATVVGKTRMTTAEEFQEILVKVKPDGSQIRLEDVAEVGLNSEIFAFTSKMNGHPSAGLAIRLAPGGNVLDATKAVKQTISELEPFFPDGMKAVFPYETAPAVEASIKAVVKTLIEAIVLVFLVMYLFLQNMRATIIPTLAVPVVLLGTFAVLFKFGFTINIITMFAMVLAIGLLVDDAIVVVENVERIMTEEGLSPKEATIKSMGQIQGALVGIGLVICAVFFPMAFFAGSTGVIYQQFSITIIAAMSLSVLIALVFTPALCATMLKSTSHDYAPKKGFFGWFNRTFVKGTQKYTQAVEGTLKRKRLSAAIVLGLFSLVVILFPKIPTAFMPDEDQGSMFVLVQLPPNASSERTQVVLEEISHYFNTTEKQLVENAMAVNSFAFAGRSQSVGLVFVRLNPFEDRSGYENSVFALAERSARHFSTIDDASVMPIIPPAIPELGTATGFDFFIMDRGGQGHAALMEARDQFLGAAGQDSSLSMVRPNGLNDEPQYKINIDDEKTRSYSVNIGDVNNTMSVAWGSYYINDFIDRGRVKKVFIQGDEGSRITPRDFDRWHVRNAFGQMVPFASFSSGEWIIGSPKLERYNGISAVEILGQGAPGVSSGEAMKKVEEIAADLPPGYDISFTGLSYEERMSGDQTTQLYAISLLIVFLCLAALYESWSIPFSVMMVVPFGVLGAVVSTLLRGLTNDVFFQVGIVTVIGLSAKNAILIVEFAKDLHEREGKPLIAAAVEAAKLRLRPILMTSLAFIGGVLPMAMATGASSASQHVLGTAVVGGTSAATFLAIFFVPLFYVLVVSLFEKMRRTPKNKAIETDDSPARA